MPEGKWPGESYEARIERLAGASPPLWWERGTQASDWPQPSPPPWPADDEDDEAPDERA